MTTNRCSLLFGVLILAAPISVSNAQDPVVSFIPSAAGAPAGNLANYGVGFELYPPNQLYWWTGYGVGGEFPDDCEIGYNLTITNAYPTVPLMSENYLITGAALDSTYCYFADDRNKRIYRKTTWSAPTDPEYEMKSPYTPPPSGYDLGAVMLWNGLFYWSDSNGTYFDIYSFNPANSGTAYVRLGSGSKIIKMTGFSYNSSVFTYTDAIFALTAGGVLLRMDINPQGAYNIVLATNVTDFAIRDESQFSPPNRISFFTTVYAATGQTSGVNSSTPPGSLLAINAASGTTTTIYTATVQNQITSVTVDTTNIYWTEQPVTCNPPFGCILGDYSTYRQSRPADYSTSPGTVDLIGLPGGGAGLNLRSDGQWLYFINGTTIKRLSTGTPKMQLDVEADGLEVIQDIQNMDSQIPLVANHPTYVRGYAHLNTDNTKTWYCTAILHGFRNGVELPGSPIFPVVSSVGLIGGGPPLALLRGNTQNTFLFKLPSSWVQSGPDLPAQLTFTMTANPDLEIPETSTQPLTNNTVSLLQPATLQDGLTPCLVTVPLISKQGSIFHYYTPGFEQIFQRVTCLLPDEHVDLDAFIATDPFGDWNNPYDFGNTNGNTSGDAWGHALGDLEGVLLFCDPFSGNNDGHLVGMVHPLANAGSGSGIGGISHRPGHVVVVVMDPTFGRGHSAQGGMTTTHELGHNYGRKHIDCGNFPPDQADFDPSPYPCSLGNPNTNLVTATFGYDPIDNVAVPPNTQSDLMTYSSPAWVSAYNWDSNLGVPPLSNAKPQPLPSPLPPTGSGLVMAVTGNFNDQLPAAALGPFYIIPQAVAPAAVLAESRIESDQSTGQSNSVYVVFRDAGGNFLSQVAVAIQDTEGNNLSMLYFGQYVDVPAGAREIQLVQAGQILAERFITPNPPTITLGAPVLDPVALTLHLSWTASDPDGDPLLFTIQYSSDNGASWRALRVNYPYEEFTFNTSLLPGGTQCLLRVIATDGANTAIAMTGAFSIPLHPPVPLIEGVNEQQPLAFGSEPPLLGLAMDAQNSSASNRLSWTLSGPTSLASVANTLPLSNLSPGNYTATLSATDTVGLAASTSRDFQVLPPTVPDGPATDFDGSGDSDGYTNSTYIPLPLEDGSLASVRMYHDASGQFHVGFYNLKFGSGTPRSIGLLADPTGTPPVAPGTNDFAFYVNENGAPLEEQGNGTTFASATNPPLGFAAAVYRGSNAWSAELSIPDSELGGWGHLATLMLTHGPVQWPPAAVTNQPLTWAPVFLGANMPPGSNLPPVANAGSGFSVSPINNLTLSLDGSASYDPDGDSLTYVWNQTEGPAVTITGTNTVTPAITVTPVTTRTNLTFQLVVNDGATNSAPSQVQITVLPPLAKPAVTQPAASAALRSDGTLELQLVGIPSQSYQIQASSNLVNWVNLSTVYADYAGRIDFEETGDHTNYPARFYRGAAQ